MDQKWKKSEDEFGVEYFYADENFFITYIEDAYYATLSVAFSYYHMPQFRMFKEIFRENLGKILEQVKKHNKIDFPNLKLD